MEDACETLIAAFDSANLVALGERHWAREDSEFRLRLIRNPAFARTVDDIVVEFASPLYQSVLDRFVNGENVPSTELCKVWQDTTQPGAWDSPIYEEFFHAVRTANAALPPARRLRVLASDSPIDWTAPDLSQLENRDAAAAALIQREVLSKDRKALLVFGAAHFYRNRPGTVVDLLKDDSRARWFILVPVGGITATNAPALQSLRNNALGELDAADVPERGSKRIKIVNGKPVLIPVFEPGVKFRDLADCCLYLGTQDPEFIRPPRALYDGTEYGKEVERRKAVLMSTLPGLG